MKKRRLCGSVPGLGSDYAHDPIIETPDPIETAIQELQDAVDALEEHDELQDDQIEKLFNADITFASWHGAKGDGITDDTAAIQAALDAGKTNVFIDPGFYNVTATLHIPSGTRLIGYRAELVFNCGTPDVYSSHIMLTNLTDGITGGYDAASKIEISGLSFSSPGDAYATLVLIRHASDISIHDCVFHGLNGWHFIEVNSSRNVRIYNNDFSDYPHNGDWTHASEMIQLDLAYTSGTAPTCEPFDNTPCSNVLICRNRFANDYIAIPDGEAQQLFPVGVGCHTAIADHENNNITISDNVFEQLSGAVRFTSLQDSFVINNKVVDCAYGIRFEEYHAGARCELFGNDIRLKRFTKTELAPTLLSATWAKYRGISIEAVGAQYAPGIRIQDNRIDVHFGYAISFTGSEAVVSGNSVYQHGALEYDIQYMSQGGIYAYECDGAIINDNYVRSEGTAYGYAAIRLSNGCKYVLVNGNNVKAASGYQIAAGTGSTNVVSDNITEEIV